MASRKLSDLVGTMEARAEALVAKCDMAGIDLLIYCTLRSLEEQARLYRQPKSADQIHAMADKLRNVYMRPDLGEILLSVGPQSGPKVTNAAPGMSAHNYGLAFDCVPLVNGKAQWSSKAPEWQEVGRLGQSLGLEWAGSWTSFREYPHFQELGFTWRQRILMG